MSTDTEKSPDKPAEKSRHIVLTSHPPAGSAKPSPIHWGAATAAERGPLVATLSDPTKRNVIGAHAGAYALYRALAIASGKLSPIHVPDLSNTSPAERIGPHPQWADAQKIVSLDPWGHMVAEVYADKIAAGWDIRPTIAVTKAHINMPELKDAILAGRLKPDGDILAANGDVLNRSGILAELAESKTHQVGVISTRQSTVAADHHDQ